MLGAQALREAGLGPPAKGPVAAHAAGQRRGDSVGLLPVEPRLRERYRVRGLASRERMLAFALARFTHAHAVTLTAADT
jgi:hypothetical protein